jgi:hypothetical protein
MAPVNLWKAVAWLTFVALVIFLTLCDENWKSGSQTPTVALAADQPPAWRTTEIQLRIDNEEQYGLVSTDGFWASTSTAKGKQLISPIAVSLSCVRSEGICRESDASAEMGILSSNVLEYTVSSWTHSGIVADDSSEGPCSIGHRLAIDFQSSSVTVTDYPKKISATTFCKPLQDANSYALHGGQIMLYPPATYDPLKK